MFKSSNKTFLKYFFFSKHINCVLNNYLEDFNFSTCGVNFKEKYKTTLLASKQPGWAVSKWFSLHVDGKIALYINLKNKLAFHNYFKIISVLPG